MLVSRKSGVFFSGVLLLGFLIGNLMHWNGMVSQGRGSFSEALDFIVESDKSERVSVSVDHSFRLGTLFSFYSYRKKAYERFVYFDKSDISDLRPEWIIFHQVDRAETERMPKVILLDSGIRYTQEKILRAYKSGVWGWDNIVYRIFRELN